MQNLHSFKHVVRNLKHNDKAVAAGVVLPTVAKASTYKWRILPLYIFSTAAAVTRFRVR